MEKLSTAPFRAIKKPERKVGKGKGKETYPTTFASGKRRVYATFESVKTVGGMR